MAELSPMMKQYFEVKKEYPDTILMFRLGDFYEMFFEDAKLASKELELVLTGRDCGQEERAPMCGVPFHSADSYIAKLVNRGYKVAICEQMEDPKSVKGIVKREVVRVLSAGTVIENSMLDETKHNYLAVCALLFDEMGVCFVDVSTGSVEITSFSENIDERTVEELARFMPSEMLINKEAATLKRFSEFVSKKLDVVAQTLPSGSFDYEKTKKTVLEKFEGKTLETLGLADSKAAVCVLGEALSYLYEAQKNNLANINEINVYSQAKVMKIGFSARRNLELCETMRERERKGSLLWVLDKTKTAMGKRLIRSWIEAPLFDAAQISKRQNAVQELFDDTAKRQSITEKLVGVYDIERLMTRILYNTANAKELLALKNTVGCLPDIKAAVADSKCAMLKDINSRIDTLDDVYDLIDKAISEDAPFSVREGGMIKAGFNAELDELRKIVHGGKEFLTELELKEQEKTGIKKLKVKYNKVFGYFIEVPNSFKEIVPDGYIRKQTLTNCERYITEELKELEGKVLGAQERIVSLEYELFSAVRKKIGEQYERTCYTSKAVACLDALCSLAHVAVENNYTRPDINNSEEIIIKDGRHPVIEKMLRDTPFVPNDTLLDCNENRVCVITGPNMAGKSTYMRQVALITIMAQLGSFVPASYASVGLCDSVFTRVGASDDLSSGQSTFMVEMSEVAEILENATAKSLIILDEIGRGTSTYDGMSIAKAVIEYTADKKKLGAKTLFATHYHELTELENENPSIKNYNISVKKRGEDIVFLRRIVRGPADGSYGIDVAKLAGVPDSVVKRARVILKALEDEAPVRTVKTAISNADNEMQMSFGSSANDEIINELKNLDVNTLTPIEAMTELFKLANKAKQGE